MSEELKTSDTVVSPFEKPFEKPLEEEELAEFLNGVVADEEEVQRQKQELFRMSQELRANLERIKKSLTGRNVTIRDIPGTLGGGTYAFSNAATLTENGTEGFVFLIVPSLVPGNPEREVPIPLQKFNGAFVSAQRPSYTATMDPTGTNIVDQRKPGV